MNYLTAIIATPLFVCVWLFELRLYWTSSPRILKEGKDIVALAYAVSTLQMTSCWFWLFGFALGTTDSVLSEAKGEGEKANCFGLVGAEVLLSIFQFLTSIYTLLQMFVVRFVYTSSVTWKVSKMKRTRNENSFLALFIALGLVYLPIAWITAWNRRCPQGTPVWPAVQHYFYSTFIIVDGIVSSVSLFYTRDVLRRVDMKLTSSSSSTAAAVPATDQNSTNHGKLEQGKPKQKGSSSESKVMELANYFSFQCKVTITGVLLAVSFFMLQYGLNLKFLSLIACVFCTLMYATYALRRVPMLMKYLRDDHSWLPKTWKTFWDTRSRPLGRSYTPTSSSTQQAGVALMKITPKHPSGSTVVAMNDI